MKSDRKNHTASVTITNAFTGEKTVKHFSSIVDKRTAERKRDMYLQKLRAGFNPMDFDAPFSWWADEWFRVYAQHGSQEYIDTIDIYVGELKRFFGERYISTIRQIDVQQFADTLSDSSKSRVDKIHGITGRIFKAAIANHMILTDPSQGVRWTSRGSGTHRMLEDWEQHAIVDYWRHSHVGFWMLFMLYTGVRRGELLGLQWKDIDFASNVIHIRRAVKSPNNERVETRGKTRAAIRDIPMFPALRQALIEQAADAQLNSPYICTTSDGTPPNMSQFRTMWENRCSWLTITTGRKFDVKPHDLRHTYCSLLYESDVSVKTAAAWLGHSDIQTTMNIYTHLSSSLEARDIAAAQNTFTDKFGDGGELPWKNTPDL